MGRKKTHWGALIRKLRLRREYTQGQLGTLIVLGREDNVVKHSKHPQHLISRYESTANPSANNVEQLLGALGYELKLRPIQGYPDAETQRVLEEARKGKPRVTPYRKPQKKEAPPVEAAPLAPSVTGAIDALERASEEQRAAASDLGSFALDTSEQAAAVEVARALQASSDEDGEDAS
jgi:transcriptional regulator with XRE-family HTH domain